MANMSLQLRQDKAAALDKAGAILAILETEKRSEMTPEEQVAFNGFKTQAEGIQKTIEAHESLSALTSNPTDRPKEQQHGRMLRVYDNALDKPWGYDLIGEKCEASTGESKVERRGRMAFCFGDFLQSVQAAALGRETGSQTDPRLRETTQNFARRAAAAGSSESVPSDGGFLVYPDFVQEVLMLAHESGVLYPLTRKLPLSEFTNAVKIPAIDETSRADGFRWGGIQAFWENEAQALVGSKPTFQLLELVTKKLTGLYYATNEVLADARMLGAYALQGFGEEFGFKLDDGVVNGTGAGQLKGILSNTAVAIQVAKETSPTTQAAATFLYQNAAKMWARMWAPCRKNAVWLINQDLESQLMLMNAAATKADGTAVGGVPVFLPPGSGMFGGASGAPLVNNIAVNGNAGTLFGRPVMCIEQCQTAGTVGDIILFDPTQYLMIDKGDMLVAQSAHVRFLTDEMTYRFVLRVDGALWWRTAITPKNGTNKLSPVVTLAAR